MVAVCKNICIEQFVEGSNTYRSPCGPVENAVFWNRPFGKDLCNPWQQRPRHRLRAAAAAADMSLHLRAHDISYWPGCNRARENSETPLGGTKEHSKTPLGGANSGVGAGNSNSSSGNSLRNLKEAAMQLRQEKAAHKPQWANRPLN